MEVKININDTVRVRLTAFGEAILAQHKIKTFEEIGGSLNPFQSQSVLERALLSVFRDSVVDEDGMHTFQLHELFSIFGHTMGVPAQQMPFFENAIYWCGEVPRSEAV